jgi:hypothetical protein
VLIDHLEFQIYDIIVIQADPDIQNKSFVVDGSTKHKKDSRWSWG